MERVGIYNRCSTEDEDQVNALDIQAQESREIAEKMNWRIIEQYVESRSGTTAEKRKEYLRMIQDIEEGRFDIIMIKSIDRLARNVKDWYLFLDCITRNHTQLYLYLDHSFYKSDDALITGIKAILAEEFSKELSKKIKNSHQRRQEKKSGSNISRPMFGWEKVGKDSFVVNEEEAAYFRRACALVEQGLGFRRIAEKIYEEGARQKDGKMLSPVQWRNMLRSPRAHGTVVLHQREYDFDTKKYKKIPQEEWIYMENALPPLISEEYHNRILAILDERTVTKQPRNTGKHFLSGKIYCRECGRKYYLSQKVWRCSKYLSEGRKTVSEGGKEQNGAETLAGAKRKNVGETVPWERGCDNQKVSQAEIEKVLLECCRRYILQKANWKDPYGQSLVRLEKQDDLNMIAEKITTELKHIWENMGYVSADGKQLKQLEEKLKKLKNNQVQLLEKLLEGIIGDREYHNFYEKSKEEEQRIQEKITVIKQRMEQYNNNSARWEAIEKKLLEGEIIQNAVVKTFSGEVHKIYIEQKGWEIRMNSGEVYHFDKDL